jgi:hypothetical protein
MNIPPLGKPIETAQGDPFRTGLTFRSLRRKSGLPELPPGRRKRAPLRVSGYGDDAAGNTLLDLAECGVAEPERSHLGGDFGHMQVHRVDVTSGNDEAAE